MQTYDDQVVLWFCSITPTDYLHSNTHVVKNDVTARDDLTAPIPHRPSLMPSILPSFGYAFDLLAIAKGQLSTATMGTSPVLPLLGDLRTLHDR